MVSSNHVMCHANLQGMLHRRFGFVSLMDDDVSPIVVGHNVWIGDNAVLLPGVAVGDGAVVGAASVVARDIPPFTVAVGSPARCIKKRFEDSIIQALQDIRWWDWPGEKIAKNRAFFEADLTLISAERLRSLIVEV
jgi:acetyltransferase-like isoleucine patch superfamily enzyme